MKKLSLSILAGLFLLLSFNSLALSEDFTISGSAYFKCSLMSKYMQKHGYAFIEEISYSEHLKTNRYAASDARVIIKDKNDITLGSGQTDIRGHFSITVPGEESYQVIVSFHGQEFKEAVSSSTLQNYIIDLGDFSSDTVGSWIDARFDPGR